MAIHLSHSLSGYSCYCLQFFNKKIYIFSSTEKIIHDIKNPRKAWVKVRNVRKYIELTIQVMAEALEVPLCDMTFEDIKQRYTGTDKKTD